MRRNFQLSPMKAPYLGGGRSVTVAFPGTSVTIIETSTVFEIVGREVQSASLGFRMTDFLTYAGVDPASRHSQNPTHA